MLCVEWGFFRYLLSTLVLMIPGAGELVRVGGNCPALFFLRLSNAVVVADCFVEH